MKKASLTIIMILAILSVTIVPVQAFIMGPNPETDSGKWELFGPHVQGISITVYSDTASEWADMGNGKLDLEDWALESNYATLWATPGGPFTEANYGGEAGYFILDVNNNATFTPNDATLGTYNPTSDVFLREAIACCVDRPNILNVVGGLANPMYTAVPNYMAGYVNSQVSPTGIYSALTFTNSTPPYGANLTEANAILNAAGYTSWDNTTYGKPDRIDPHTGKALYLIFYSRTGLRNLVSNDIATNLWAVGIGNVLIPYPSIRPPFPDPVYAQHHFNLYIGGWTGIGPDPDYLCDLYNSSNYYYPGSPPNYDAIRYSDLDAALTGIKLASSFAAGNASTWNAQYLFALHCAAVPLWSTTGVKDYKNVPVASGAAGNWTDLVNQKGIGVNSWWATLDMDQQGALYPQNYTQYGFSSTVTLQNIVYAQWFWDMEVLGRIYDGGWARDPYTLQWGVPQLFENYTVGTWTDPFSHATKSSVTFTLRPDAYWQDGQPVTVADVYYTLVEISKDLLAKGFPPPSWYPTVQYMKSVEILDDYNVRVLLDTYSVWAVGWVIGNTIIPMHIWKLIVDASNSPTSNPFIQQTTPDPNIIGTGPYRWHRGIGTSVSDVIVLTANTPGSVETAHDFSYSPAPALRAQFPIPGTPIVSPGYYLYCPVMATIFPHTASATYLMAGAVVADGMSKVNLDPSAAGTTLTVDLALRDLWYGNGPNNTIGILTVNKYIDVQHWYKGSLVGHYSGYPLGPTSKTLTTVSPYPLGTSDVEPITLTLGNATLWIVKLAVQITGPASLPDGETNPWLNTWINVSIPIWVTIVYDIVGTDLPTVMVKAGIWPNVSYPADMKAMLTAPDLKIDGADIAYAAAAFGTKPGDPTWSAVSDVNTDYKVDGQDIALIAMEFGWPYWPSS